MSKCLSYRCNENAVYKVDNFNFCPHHAIEFIGLKALLNMSTTSDDTCSHCGKALYDDFIAQDARGNLYCSIACAFACNGVKWLGGDDDEH